MPMQAWIAYLERTLLFDHKVHSLIPVLPKFEYLCSLLFHRNPGVLQKFREITRFSRSFPGPWKKISKFQEFSRNSRSSEHHVQLSCERRKTLLDEKTITKPYIRRKTFTLSQKLTNCVRNSQKSFKLKLLVFVDLLGTEARMVMTQKKKETKILLYNCTLGMYNCKFPTQATWSSSSVTRQPL